MRNLTDSVRIRDPRRSALAALIRGGSCRSSRRTRSSGARSDLTAAAACEYALLRRLDERTGRVEAMPPPSTDPLLEQIAPWGWHTRKRVLEELEAELGVHAEARPGGVSRLRTGSLHLKGRSGVAGEVDARSVRRISRSWSSRRVSSTASSSGTPTSCGAPRRAGWSPTPSSPATPATALLQIAAYADQLESGGLPVAPTVELILGTGATVSPPAGRRAAGLPRAAGAAARPDRRAHAEASEPQPGTPTT